MTPRPPEPTQTAIALWWGIIALEVVHQLLNITMGILNRHEATAQAVESLENSGNAALNERIAETTVVVSTVLIGVVALCVVGVLAWLVTKLRTPHIEGTKPSIARRSLSLFGWYLAIRGAFTFTLVPAAAIPVWLTAMDGSIKIIIGVGGVVTALLLAKKETVEWAGESR